MTAQEIVVIVIISTMLLLLVERVPCLLTKEPADVYAVKGSDVILSCSTDLQVPVLWMYKRSGVEDNWMFLDEAALSDNPRFQIYSDPIYSNQHNLAITDVRLEDAGTFRCIDDEGFGYDLFLDGIPNNVATVHLYVIDNELKCWSNNNIQHLQEETFESENNNCAQINMHCTINFAGNSTPLLKWTLIRPDNASEIGRRSLSLRRYSLQSVSASKRYFRLESGIKLSALGRLNQSYIICQVFSFGDMSTSTQSEDRNLSGLFWRSEKLRIIGSKASKLSSPSIVHHSNNSDLMSALSSNDSTRNVSTTVKILKQDKTVRGLTVLDEELFVSRENQSFITVYNIHTLTASRNITIPNWLSTRSLAACACNRALYISDWKLECIHRVDLNTDSVTRWRTGEIYMPEGLFLTTEHTLLATVWLRGYPGENRLVEYTTDGQLVREIPFDPSIQYAHLTIQLSSNRFIVAYGDRRTSLQRICMINAQGQILKCFGGAEGRGEGHLSGPYSLALDYNRRRIYVADCWNKRVIILDTDLTYRGLINASVAIRYPYRLYFDSSTDLLFIGEFSTGSGSNAGVIIINPTD